MLMFFLVLLNFLLRKKVIRQNIGLEEVLTHPENHQNMQLSEKYF